MVEAHHTVVAVTAVRRARWLDDPARAAPGTACDTCFRSLGMVAATVIVVCACRSKTDETVGGEFRNSEPYLVFSALRAPDWCIPSWISNR